MHPMLVTIPIGCFVAAVAADIVSIWAGPGFFPEMATWLIAFGVIGALVAAVPGFVDLLTVPMSPSAKNLAGWHAMLNLAVIIVFGLAFALRFGHYGSGLGYALTALGIVVVAVSGAIGNRLAHRHLAGSSEGDLATTRSTQRGVVEPDSRVAH
ncbi:MAG TPA: DUF2231 domain-containing protein [Candidatus Acidoferrales bacterium]|nr:DUF2231 domain-containing protein [Candidatus Acidoferrales bacterium]